MANGANGEASPYVELEREAWAALGRATEQPLTPEEIERVRGLGDELDLDEVTQVYLPVSRLLSLYVEAAGKLHRQQEEFLHQSQPPRTPFVIGLAGSGQRLTDTEFRAWEHYEDVPPVRESGPSAFVTVQRGCDYKCTFCIVPYTRGPERSRRLADGVRGVEQLAGQGS